MPDANAAQDAVQRASSLLSLAWQSRTPCDPVRPLIEAHGLDAAYAVQQRGDRDGAGGGPARHRPQDRPDRACGAEAARRRSAGLWRAAGRDGMRRRAGDPDLPPDPAEGRGGNRVRAGARSRHGDARLRRGDARHRLRRSGDRSRGQPGAGLEDSRSTTRSPTTPRPVFTSWARRCGSWSSSISACAAW